MSFILRHPIVPIVALTMAAMPARQALAADRPDRPRTETVQTAGSGPTTPDQQPADLSLEALMQVTIEPVFGASLRLQPLTEAPAAVTIVTADDIRRFGYRTLGDVLASVRGFYVTDDRNYSYIGARGFALPGDYSTRVLLLVDGHRLNDVIYEQAMAGHELGIDLSAVERIEVIRGPGSALYGASAFFGVVNVITRTGAGFDGARVATRVGSLGTRSVRLNAGRAFSNGVDAAFTAATGRTDGVDRLYFPEYDTPQTSGGVAREIDRERYHRISGRLEFRRLTLSGGAASRYKQVPTAAYDTVFGDPRFTTTDARAYLAARYEQTTAGGTRISLQTAVDRYRYDGDYPGQDASAGGVILLRDYAEGRWWSAETRVSREIRRRHAVTVGVQLREAFRQVQGGGYDDDPASEFRIDKRTRMAAIYGHDEITVSRHVRMTAGLRYDSYAGFDRVTPRLAAIVKTSDDQAFKYLFGTAFRAPNAFELSYYSHPEEAALSPETIESHEVVWERYEGRWLRTTAAAYVNTISDLITFTGDDQTGLYAFENVGRVRSRGLELEAEVRHWSGLQAQVSYVLQDTFDRDLGSRLVNSPRHTLSLQTSTTLPGGATAAMTLNYLGRRLTIGGESVDPALVAQASARLPLRHGFALAAVAGNVFNARYADPGSAEHRQVTIPRNGRTVSVELEWTSR